MKSFLNPIPDDDSQDARDEIKARFTLLQQISVALLPLAGLLSSSMDPESGPVLMRAVSWSVAAWICAAPILAKLWIDARSRRLGMRHAKN